jgi:type VI secretion system secreted protein Hcp
MWELSMANWFLTLKCSNAGQVKGEATHKGFEDYLEIESWNWQATNAPSTPDGSRAGKVKMEDFTFTMKYDKAHVALFKCLAMGDKVEEAVLKGVREAAGGKQEYFKATLKDGLVTLFQVSGSGEQKAIPEVTFKLSFREIGFDYRPQTEDASLGPAHRAQHDLGKGK